MNSCFWESIQYFWGFTLCDPMQGSKKLLDKVTGTFIFFMSQETDLRTNEISLVYFGTLLLDSDLYFNKFTSHQLDKLKLQKGIC